MECRTDEKGEIEYQDIEELYVSPAVKRPIWQTIKIVREITNIMGGAPKRIFVEVAREPGEKGVRKVSRRNQLLDLYKACKRKHRNYTTVWQIRSLTMHCAVTNFSYIIRRWEDVCIPEMPLIWMSYSQTDMILIIYIHNRRLWTIV